MKVTDKQINSLRFFKLPVAFLCGVKLLSLTKDACVARVQYKWINQNPFKSIYFAVLAMAAELSTAGLVLKATGESGYRFSTLVIGLNAQFSKKAVGKILFTCNDAKELNKCIHRAKETKEGVVFTLTSIGLDESGDEVARFDLTWSIKVKL